MSYMLPNATRLQINCEAAKIRRTENENEYEGVLVKANYHKELPGKITPDEIKAVIFLFSKRCSHFSRTVKKIFSLGTNNCQLYKRYIGRLRLPQKSDYLTIKSGKLNNR